VICAILIYAFDITSNVRKAQQGRLLLVVGILLILFGVYASVFPVNSPPHLKVYFDISNSSVSLLETTAEYAIPFSVMQPYIQNLSTGDRTLMITASYNGRSVLNQSYQSVGVGYDIVRTNTLTANVPSGSNITVVARLFSSGHPLSTDTTSVIANPTGLWLVMGVSSGIVGAFFIVRNYRFVKAKPSERRKRRAATKE